MYFGWFFSSFQVRGLFAKDTLTWECDTAKHLQPSLPRSVNYAVVSSSLSMQQAPGQVALACASALVVAGPDNPRRCCPYALNASSWLAVIVLAISSSFYGSAPFSRPPCDVYSSRRELFSPLFVGLVPGEALAASAQLPCSSNCLFDPWSLDFCQDSWLPLTVPGVAAVENTIDSAAVMEPFA